LKPDAEMPVPVVAEPAVEAVAATLEEVKITETEAKSTEEKVEEACEKKKESEAPKAEEKIIEKTNVSEITKPQSTEGECATRE